MKKIFFSLVVLLSITAFTVAGKLYADKMESFRWLIGSWTMQTSKGSIMETWVPMNDSSFAGESVLIKYTSELVPLEKIQLVCSNNEYYYIPVAQGQNNDQPVRFRITSHNLKGFTAENPDHDFPRRITYSLINKDSIHARIDGGPSLPDKKSDYYYKRYKK